MRPSWVEVDLTALAENVDRIRRVVAPARLCAVIKADAYGHGDVPVAMTAVEHGASMLAVALTEEGIRLREAGIDAPILLLSEPPLADVERVVKWDLTPTAYHIAFLDGLPPRASVHLKLDTGMHRVGADEDALIQLAQHAVDRGLALAGVWTHLAVAEEDSVFTKEQLDRFGAMMARLSDLGLSPAISHAANTAGALLHADSRFDLVRVGLGMYGLHPSPATRSVVDLRPVMRLVSHVSHVRRFPKGARPSYGRRRPLEKDSTVATVPIGYADGLPRALSAVNVNVLIGGRRMPLAGTVTMDQIVVDVGDHSVEIGDEVVLIGAQGEDEITADEWADATNTITYEIVSRMGPRLPRRHVG